MRGTKGLPAALTVALAAVVLGGCGVGGSTTTVVSFSTTADKDKIASERLPHPKHLDVATRSEAKRSAQAKAAAPKGPGSIRAASAGTNGSFDPHSQGKTVDVGSMSGSSAVLLNGVALAPPNAPQRIKATVSAANEIVGAPYVWGGGHSSWYSRGYDCSGAVSYALAGGGFLRSPQNSSGLERWGAPGRGRWMTVYANSTHAYAVIAGLRWDTVGDAHGTGPKWHAELPYPKSFVARHYPGY
jgi:hypothetical protein